MTQVEVWDFATRAFHWLLVTVVLVCFLTGEDEGLAFVVHAYAGFVVFMLLVFRIGWGFFGSRHSRFSDFAYSRSEIKNHALSVLRLKPEPHVGHNPLGGLMIFLMLAVLVATSLSGMTMVVAGASWLEDIHEVLGSTMQTLVAVHIVGVLLEQVLTREKLVRAMITGFKTLTDDQALKERRPAPAWRALLLAAMLATTAFYLFDQINYSGAVSTFAAEEKERERDDD